MCNCLTGPGVPRTVRTSSAITVAVSEAKGVLSIKKQNNSWWCKWFVFVSVPTWAKHGLLISYQDLSKTLEALNAWMQSAETLVSEAAKSPENEASNDEPSIGSQFPPAAACCWFAHIFRMSVSIHLLGCYTCLTHVKSHAVNICI